MSNILITGTSRGIGLGLVSACLANGDRVFAVVRSPASGPLQVLQAQYPDILQVVVCALDSAEASQQLLNVLGNTRLDVALFNAGTYGPAHQDSARIDSEEIAELFQTNAITPVHLARALSTQMNPGGVLAFVSSQMASVELARAADMPLYGASKAALNSLLRSWSASTEQPAACLLALHPGWVKTAMGGDNAPVSVEQSAAGLLQSIHQHRGQRGCYFVDYQQQTLPW